MKLSKLSPALGAEVLGVDLAQPLDDTRWRDIERAWHEHSVLLFRSQTLGDLEQVAFAARFGELAQTLKDYEGGKIHPALMYVTNEKRDGKYVPIPPRYRDPEKSGLTYTVRAGSQTHDIELRP